MLAVNDDGRARAMENAQSANKFRLMNPATREFLYMSGEGVVKTVEWSWLGYRYQADTLQERAEIRGEAWPFQPIHRAHFDEKSAGEEANV